MTFLQKLTNSDFSLGLLRKDKTCQQSRCQHSWASASRPMPPASTFRHPASQCDSGVFRYQTGPHYSGTGLVPEYIFYFGTGLIRCWTVPVRRLKNCRKEKRYISRHVHVCTSDGGKGTSCMSLFLGPQKGTRLSARYHFTGPKNSRISGPNPLPS